MVAHAKMTPALWTNLAQARGFSLKQEGFSLKLEITLKINPKKCKLGPSVLIV